MLYGLSLCFRAAIVFFLLFFVSEGTIFAEEDLSQRSVMDLSKIDFFPLKVGNEWQYEIEHYIDGQDSKTVGTTRIGSETVDNKTGIIEYRREQDKPFMLKTDEGLMSPTTGFMILKYPIKAGAEWSSGMYNYDQRLSRIEEIGLSLTVADKTYSDCIRVKTISDFHATSRKESVVYLAGESIDIFCPHIGLVLSETFDVSRDGTKALRSRIQLKKFTTGQTLGVEEYVKKKDTGLIDTTESFRFPKKGFLHPFLSPDDKWLIYKKDETIGHELYYTELGRSDEFIVPIQSQDDKKVVDRVGEVMEWSPDGKILAVSARLDSDDKIVLINFASGKPNIMESFKTRSFTSGGDTIKWTNDGLLVYCDEYSNIMKKWPGKQAEPVVYVRSSHSVRLPAENSFQLLPDGTLLYKQREYQSLSGGNVHFVKDSLSVLNVANPKSKLQVYSGEKIYNIILSPQGHFALLLFQSYAGANEGKAQVLDLRTKELTITLPLLEKAAWSPEGSQLAYLEKTVPLKDIHNPGKILEWPNPHFKIVDMSTSRTRDYGYHLTKQFSWTPDGKYIIYGMKCIHPSLGEYDPGIFIMRVSDGEEIARLTKISSLWPPFVSKSGEYIIWNALNMSTFFVIKNPLDPKMFHAR